MLQALRNPRNYVAYVFMLPAMAVLVLGLIVPVYNAIELSF
jgi:ABC-type sugar transport system permease subunit